MEPLKDKLLLDIWPDKAQYRSGEDVRLIAELVPHARPVGLIVSVFCLYNKLSEITYESLAGESRCVIPLGRFYGNIRGFGVTVREKESGRRLNTAFDVTDRPNRLLRYGFLSDFTSSDSGEADLDSLLKCHINAVQFYDWAYRHDELVPPQNLYRDMMGKEIDLSIVKTKIQGCRDRGMKTVGYGAVYAASREYSAAHPDEALYTSTGQALVFIDKFHIMNVASQEWRGHIIAQYRAALEQVGFDGVHMDTYGFPKTAFTSSGRRIKLDNEYPALIEAARWEMPDGLFIFNNVGGWPADKTACAPQDAVYIEVWPPNDTYAHIRQIILDAHASCGRTKSVILAAYLAPFKTEAEERSVNAAIFLFAAISAHGATHLLFGEENAVLTQGYYSDYTQLSYEAAARLRLYHDFAVRYAGLLCDLSLLDVTMTHIGWDNTEYRCGAEKWSVSPETGKLWIIIREDDSRKLIQVINLTGCDNTVWNGGKSTPKACGEIPFAVQVDFPVAGIWHASPDSGDGGMLPLGWRAVETERDRAVEFVLPCVKYWSLIYIEMPENS